MDRVSNLPDEVLCHILSSLPTKQAVVTSALAKRWINVWKLVPNDLYIDDSVFLHPEEGKGAREEIRQSFVDFMDTVLTLQGDSPVNTFSLKCITGIDPVHVNRWICNVLKRGVTNLKLFIDFADEDMGMEYKLPEELFVSKTLAELKLRSEVFVNWWHQSGGAFLPMLTSLEIDSKEISCCNVEKFIPSFIAIEELRMTGVVWMEEDVTLSSGSLKELSIQAIVHEDSSNPDSVSFDTPNLLSFSYSDLVAEDYPLVNMKKLTQATIKFILKDDEVKRIREPNNVLLEDDGEIDVISFGNVVKLMNGIQSVETLSIFADTLEVLSLCESMPVFKNLKFLGITSSENRGWQAMPVLLKNSPHLETIILQGLLHHVTEKCGDTCPCVSREDKGCSLKSCRVKLLEIQGFRGTMKEMEVIKHFLDFLLGLKRMKIYIKENAPTQLKNREVSNHVLEMIDLYNQRYSCNVELLVSDALCEKWTAHGSM